MKNFDNKKAEIVKNISTHRPFFCTIILFSFQIQIFCCIIESNISSMIIIMIAHDENFFNKQINL